MTRRRALAGMAICLLFVAIFVVRPALTSDWPMSPESRAEAGEQRVEAEVDLPVGPIGGLAVTGVLFGGFVLLCHVRSARPRSSERE